MSQEDLGGLNNITLFAQSYPSGLLSGTTRGIGNAAVGALSATALMVAAPIKGSIDGYQGGGFVGATAGLTVGVIVGSLAGSVLAAGGVLSCAQQIVLGLVKTPESVVASATGKDWDEEAQQWILYNLKVDISKTLSMSDEEFLAALKTHGSIYAVFSSDNQLPIVVETNEAEKKAKKNVLDREFYDILGIEPEATMQEIKRAYYVKARQHHPDRCKNDAEANAKFQKIGEAYQVLSDERLRAAYDSKGREAVDHSSKIDATALYAMLFGSENFEPIIGELQLATQFKSYIDGSLLSQPMQLFQFRQRKREVQLASNLAQKLDVYVNGDESAFTEKAKSEAKELAETALGGVLLSVVGSIYMDRARSELSTLAGCWISVQQVGSAVSDAVSIINLGTKTAVSAIELQNLQSKYEGLHPGEHHQNTSTNPLASFGPPPNASEAEKELFKKKTRDMSANVLALMWQVTKIDIQSTLTSVCNKVLHDHSVDEQARAKRANALYALGEIYRANNASVEQGLDELLDKLGMQFEQASREAQKTEEAEINHDKKQDDAGTQPVDENDKWCSIYIEIHNLSAKELKEMISEFNESCDDCFEKGDLQNKLKGLIEIRVGDKILAYKEVVQGTVIPPKEGDDLDELIHQDNENKEQADNNDDKNVDNKNDIDE